MDELDALQASLNGALDALRDELSAQNLPPLSSTATEQHPLDDPAYLGSPRIFEARRLALGCIGQLRNLLQVPYEKVVEQSFAVYDTACMNIAVSTGMIDVLAESPALSVVELAKRLDLHPIKVATVLRYLATQGWLIEHEYNKTAFQLSHNTSLSLFDHLKAHPAEFEQWSKSVRSLGAASQKALINDYPWASLDSKTFVDCGGGHGYLSMLLSQELKNSKFIIQDLPEVVRMTKKNVEREYLDQQKEGRLIVEPHDFFQPQPRKADVYMFRYILHNWSNDDCVTILKKSASAAPPEAKFLIIEYIPHRSGFDPSHAPRSTLDDFRGLQDYRPLEPPAFIPLNYGVNAKMHSALGVHMMGVFNAAERYMASVFHLPLSYEFESLITLSHSQEEWEEIIEAAGMHIEGVRALRANVSVIECVMKPVHVNGNGRVNGMNGTNGTNGYH
ncbi:putative O-methyltransferase [Favolaschia claudopus]|uniref:O-methyltransferase n=1 Tax=Favolaschia claudopus TaxID=2862362 RepID=A0AAW0DTV6_9AGAR